MAETTVAAPEPAPNEVTRSVTIQLNCEREQKVATRMAIQCYRAACRQMFAVLAMAQQAGAHIEVDNEAEKLRVIPDSDKSKEILALAMGKEGKAFGYELRDYFLQHLYPGVMSFVWDSARRDIVTVWSSKDPEFPRATRGYLMLNGARGLAQFNWRGIGFPRATARPKLDKHGLTLKWCQEVGPICYTLPPLDGGRYWIWKALRDKEPGWKLGTLYLNESSDGKLRTTISYTKPAQLMATDPERICRVTLTADDPTQFIRIAGPDGAATMDQLSGDSVVGWLRQMMARRVALENRRRACGNPKRPWGHRKGWLAAQDVLSRCTRQRENGVQNYNHAWSRRIVSRAVSWRCGQIIVEPLPVDMFGHPWQWLQFCQFLRYKGEYNGIQVTAKPPLTLGEDD